MLKRFIRSVLLYALLVGTLILHSSASAQQPLLTRALEDFVRTQTQGLPGKVSFNISPLDSRTQLAPCQFFEPFIPPGSKLWGKSIVGVRCIAPTNWTIYVPISINVSGNYLTSARNLPSGTVVSSEDISVRTGDLTTFPPSVLTEPTQAIGKKLRSSVVSNTPLRNDLLIAPWAVQQGQTVRTISNGPGFSVSSEGKAINNALEGQVVQVRTSSGQTVSGIARSTGIVDVSH